MAGKVTVGLTSHWPRVTQWCTHLWAQWPGKGISAPSLPTIHWSTAPLPLDRSKTKTNNNNSNNNTVFAHFYTATDRDIRGRL